MTYSIIGQSNGYSLVCVGGILVGLVSEPCHCLSVVPSLLSDDGNWHGYWARSDNTTKLRKQCQATFKMATFGKCEQRRNYERAIFWMRRNIPDLTYSFIGSTLGLNESFSKLLYFRVSPSSLPTRGRLQACARVVWCAKRPDWSAISLHPFLTTGRLLSPSHASAVPASSRVARLVCFPHLGRPGGRCGVSFARPPSSGPVAPCPIPEDDVPAPLAGHRAADTRCCDRGPGFEPGPQTPSLLPVVRGRFRRTDSLE
ncbi:unnamed protein product [Protopolystoma xenopodis]|uniref:Uncharacterized protein n=1 Tax=Protopolystoma xenopodis TaxID=117903 RepID=A0A448WFF0_9PLAT|nr:unnamed protein product [Protopolystoma xenopodis]